MAPPKKITTALPPPIPAQAPKVREWRPPDALSGFQKDPRFAYRFVSKDQANRVQHMVNQGWEIVRGAGATQRSDGSTSMDQATHYKGLIVMRMPKEMARQRNEFYRNKGNQRMRTMQALANLGEQSRQINQKTGMPLTGTFGRSVIRTAAGTKVDEIGGRQALEETRKEDIEEVQHLMAEQDKENQRLREELARLKAEKEGK